MLPILVMIVLVGGSSGWIRWRYAAWNDEAREAVGRSSEGERPSSQPLWFHLYSMIVPGFAAVAGLSAVWLLLRSSGAGSAHSGDPELRVLNSIAVVITAVYALAASKRLKPRDRWGRAEDLRMFRPSRRHHA
jgi:hypothetical protein